MKSLGITTRQLPCRLSDAERQKMGGEIAQAWQDLSTETVRQTSLKAEMKARATEIEARLTRLSQVLSRGDEVREVHVERTLLDEDGDGKGMVSETRLDTGEVLETRPIRDDERQLTMPPESVADMVADANRTGADGLMGE